MRVYSSVRLGVDPQINVLATIVVRYRGGALIAVSMVDPKQR
jgi:ABC-type spermidine/putrescine transport system permease subunit II